MNPVPVIATFLNIKGGVGKTSSAILVTRYLQAAGKKCLLIDSDIQRAVTFTILQDEEVRGERSLARALATDNIADNIVPVSENTNGGKIDLLPSSLNLVNQRNLPANSYRKLVSSPSIAGKYDFIVFDTPGNYDGFLISAAYASTTLCLPFLFSMQDIVTTCFTIEKLKEEFEDLSNKNIVLIANRIRHYSNEGESSTNRQYATVVSQYLPAPTNGQPQFYEIPDSSDIKQATDAGLVIKKSSSEKVYSAIEKIACLMAGENLQVEGERF